MKGVMEKVEAIVSKSTKGRDMVTTMPRQW
jgi:hypothetical protein